MTRRDLATNDDPVPEHIMELAAGKQLGWLRAQYQPQQRWVFTRWNDWRLYFFEEGLIVTSPEGLEMDFRWESVTVFQCLSTLNSAVRDAAYTLVGPDLEAITIGRGTSGLLRVTVDGQRVPSVVRGAPFAYEGVWGPEIQKGVTRMRLPGALGRIGRGETLDFNEFTVTAESVSVKNKSLPWAQVTGIDVSNGLLSLSEGRRTLPSVTAYEVPNLQLALVLMELLWKESSPPPHEGPPARSGEGR